MSCRTNGIVEVGVRTEFRAALQSCPFFDRYNESSADPLSTTRLFHKPPFKIRDAARMASLRVWANQDLGKTDGTALVVDSKENLRRIAPIAAKERSYFPRVLTGRRGPKALTHSFPIRRVTLPDSSYFHWPVQRSA